MRDFAFGASAARSARSLSRKADTWASMSSSGTLYTCEQDSERVERLHALFVLQLQLKLQTLDFNLALALMIEDPLVRFAMFRRGRVPGVCPILTSLVRAQDRQIALNVAICTAESLSVGVPGNMSLCRPSAGSRQSNAVVHRERSGQDVQACSLADLIARKGRHSS